MGSPVSSDTHLHHPPTDLSCRESITPVSRCHRGGFGYCPGDRGRKPTVSIVFREYRSSSGVTRGQTVY